MSDMDIYKKMFLTEAELEDEETPAEEMPETPENDNVDEEENTESELVTVSEVYDKIKDMFEDESEEKVKDWIEKKIDEYKPTTVLEFMEHYDDVEEMMDSFKNDNGVEKDESETEIEEDESEKEEKELKEAFEDDFETPTIVRNHYEAEVDKLSEILSKPSIINIPALRMSYEGADAKVKNAMVNAISNCLKRNINSIKTEVLNSLSNSNNDEMMESIIKDKNKLKQFISKL